MYANHETFDFLKGNDEKSIVTEIAIDESDIQKKQNRYLPNVLFYVQVRLDTEKDMIYFLTH